MMDEEFDYDNEEDNDEGDDRLLEQQELSDFAQDDLWENDYNDDF